MSIFDNAPSDSFDQLDSLIECIEKGIVDFNYLLYDIETIFNNVHSLSSNNYDYYLPFLIDASDKLNKVIKSTTENTLTQSGWKIWAHVNSLNAFISFIYKSDKIHSPFNFFYYCLVDGSRFEYKNINSRFRCEDKYSYSLEYITKKNRQLNSYDYYLLWANEIISESKKEIVYYVRKRYYTESDVKNNIRTFIDECKNSSKPMASGLRDKALQMYIEIALIFRFDIKLEDVYFDYILKYFVAFMEIDSKYSSMPFEDFYYNKGDINLNRELSTIFEEMKYYKNNFYNNIGDVNNFVDFVLGEIRNKTYSIIDIYLKTLAPKFHSEFKKTLAQKVNNMLENCNYSKTNYTNTFLSNLVSLRNYYTYNNKTKPSSNKIDTQYSTNEKKKKKGRSAKIYSYKWTGSQEDLNRLFKLSSNKILETDLITFRQIFSGDKIENKNKIKWLLNVNGKKEGNPEIITIFHFLYRLMQHKLISTNYNFINKKQNTRIESSNFYEQIANFFILSNNAPINKHNLRNKKFTTTPSKNKILIDSILKSL